MQEPGWIMYQEFIIPQLSQLLAPLFSSRVHISVLEIGPGPESVLGHLPGHLRRKIRRYAAFQPSDLLATRLEKWLCSTPETESPLSWLESPPDIHHVSFDLDSNTKTDSTSTRDGDKKFDVILFCSSMYSMDFNARSIKRALGMLVERPEGGMVVAFYRDGTLALNGLVCHQTASFLTGAVYVADDNKALNSFCPFIAGYVMQDVEEDKAMRAKWRKVCRELGCCENAHPGHLLFSSPHTMAAFPQHATTLPELTAQVPLLEGGRTVKNWVARLHHPASVVRPTEVRHIRQCVQWALKHGFSLTVVGGYCLRSNVVSVDMSAFDKVHIIKAGSDGQESGFDSVPLIVAEGGCKTGDITRKTMAAGLTVPLGIRPSVGAGLWLQGGIGQLGRIYGLACDAIVGAVIVSVDSSQTIYIGHVPRQHRPAGAERPENGNDLLWAIKGAGTNLGIVVSVTFKAYAAVTFWTRDWVYPLNDSLDAQRTLSDFDNLLARKLPQSCSADAWVYWDVGKLHLGVTAMDGVKLLETEMYMFRMHSKHANCKTSSFKRCLFLKGIGALKVAKILVAAVETRPTPFSYLHLIQGGGAVGDVAANATAFGCQDWDFAYVITGVWPREQDGTILARSAVEWVYNIASKVLPVSNGVYGADLGPDPRDAALAAKAFGLNRPRLARIKHGSDPRNVLAYACPLPKVKMEQKLIVLVTGASGAGKDYCADIWVSVFLKCTHKAIRARVVSISDTTKQEYAAVTGADLDRLLRDRAYKEKHQPALTAFFQNQVQHRPCLPEEHFLNAVNSARDVDVLLITGMRDEAPVAAFSHLVPDSRLLEICVQASKEMRRARRGCHEGDDNTDDSGKDNSNRPKPKPLDYRPSLIFNNDLLPFFHEDLKRLADLVLPEPNFPRPDVEFRHVLNISRQPGGLSLCTSLLQTHFTDDWAKVDVIAFCEAGGFIYASALASRVNVPLALIREAGKLPPPTVSVLKSTSHISWTSNSNDKMIEIERDLIPRGARVLVVDDVLSTGKTLCAVLQLLNEVEIADVSIMLEGWRVPSSSWSGTVAPAWVWRQYSKPFGI
ncbi:Higher eukaryotic phosphomevalonate kinase [Penicillium vulpinum]|uniref:Higher eukaryotic phosphomevalonate kinase n=1 Tax=Penicillium vulpinum TaxID=29845 RepID=UPI002547E041|nr:Higher eukaryotic phosphomevalonate kinase [Penicillium vulpinum]KAJ5958393.1 Higher eukaryotic phosphomevalonate kinase [Penicillium vulpinum]